MQSELIESVRALAEAQKDDSCISTFAELLGARGNGSRIMKLMDTFTVDFDFPALLAALERAERIHQDAVAINAGYKNGIYEIAASDKEQHELVEAFFADLDAALKEIQ